MTTQINSIKTLLLASTALALLGCPGDTDNLPPLGSGLPPPTSIVHGASVTYQDETYPTVVIGNQTWLAKNLNYNTAGSVCYNNQEYYCNTYGRLYTWAMAMDIDSHYNSEYYYPQYRHRGICPQGWHIPDDYDWNELFNFVGYPEGKHLKAANGWNENNGIDTYGFAALPGGYGGSDGYFGTVGSSGYLWSATESSASSAHSLNMLYLSESAYWSYNSKTSLLSVRCIMD